MDNEKKIEIPFGAFDSELIRQEINIPNGFNAVIDGNKIILTRIESEDERVRKALLEMVHDTTGDELWVDYNVHKEDALAWLEKQGEQKQEINNFDVLPGLYKCVHRMFDGTPDGRLLFEVGNVYRCLSKHDRAEFEVSYGHSVYLEDPVVCKHFIPFEKQDEVESDNDDIEVEEKGIRKAFNKIWDEKQGESSDQIHYWTEEEIEPIISDYLRGTEHYGGMIARLRCLKPKSLEKQCKQKPQRMISAEAKEAMYKKPADTVEQKCEESKTKIFDAPTPFEDKLYAFVAACEFLAIPSKIEFILEHSQEILDAAREQIGKEQSSTWNEEDERLRHSCIAHIEDELEQIRNDKYGHSEIISDLKESCRERIKWLESLKDRYTWKPSDEQLEALKNAIHIKPFKNPSDSILWGLYEQLNKLKS